MVQLCCPCGLSRKLRSYHNRFPGLKFGRMDGLRCANKTMFVTRLSEELEGKAAGGKGSEACWSKSRTFFADNADLNLCS